MLSLQLTKTLARDIADLDDLIDEALGIQGQGEWQRVELDKMLREMPLQVHAIKTSLLAYAQDPNLRERIML